MQKHLLKWYLRLVFGHAEMTDPMTTGDDRVLIVSLSMKRAMDACSLHPFAKACEEVRFCRKCMAVLPISSFRNEPKVRFLCTKHLRDERKKYVVGTPILRAFNALRCRARQDVFTFGFTKMQITRSQMIALLSDEHVANFSQYSLIPLRPDKPLSSDNAIIVSVEKRRYVVGVWRKTRDPDEYVKNLKLIL